MSKELLQAIDQLVEKNTFSLEAVKAIQALRDKGEKLVTELGEAEKRINNQFKIFKIEKAAREAAQVELAALKKRFEELFAREANITKLEKDAAVATAISNSWHDAFHTVFANRVTREKILTRDPVFSNPSPGCNPYVTGTSERAEEVSREEK